MAAIVTLSFPNRMCLRRHGLSQADEIDLTRLIFQPLYSRFESTLSAAQRYRLQEVAIWHVPESVTLSVHSHQSLGARIIGSEIVITDRPRSEICRSEP